MFKTWLKNNYGYVLLVLSVCLNILFIWFYFQKPNLTKGEIERKEIQNKIDSLFVLDTLQQTIIQEQICIIDSISELKRKPIYIKSKIKKKYEKAYIKFVGANDSVQLYEWTKSARK